MPISVSENNRVFHLFNEHCSAILALNEENLLEQAYWGAAIPDAHLAGIVEERRGEHLNYNVSGYEAYAMAYPGFGTGDQRSPAYNVVTADGHRASELTYKIHKVESGKPTLTGLPATYCENDDEADTLIITLEDQHHGLEVDLAYTIFAAHSAIAQHAVLRNVTNTAVHIERAMSASAAFPRRDLHMVRLAGAWGRERGLECTPLTQGLQSIESRRGSSGHQLNPFFALTEQGVDEEQGDVYGFSLIYSGNHLGQVEVCSDFTSRAMIGMGSFDFSWKLNGGESFTTPEAVLVYSPAGLGDMSRTYHKLYRTRLCRGTWRDKTRPVLINNWEATYFDFTPDKLVDIAREGKNIGLDLFVLDDGWFGKRDNDQSGLGDWVVNENKLPGGLYSLAKRINDEGLKFGLWFEPEMVSPDSDLYRAHPDWCIHIPDRRRTISRFQLVLDLTRKEVREHIVEQLSDILANAPIEYVKWDFNRNLSEMASPQLPPEQQRELPHRYVLGLYEMLETLVNRFPHILWESCSGGGGRFDPGMLHYMPQTWTSDNTDAVSRLKIQYGTSLVYPLSSMGSHVSAVPNHQVGRTTPIQTRAYTAFFGTYGFELDLSQESDVVKAASRKHVELFKQYAPLIHNGDLYRLQSPFIPGEQPWERANETSWMVVSDQAEQAILFWARVTENPNPGARFIKLRGLNPEITYTVRRLEDDNTDTAITRTGTYLMNAGFRLPGSIKSDFQNRIWLIEHCSG